MDQQISFIFQFFPAITLGVICLNALIWWVRGRTTRREFPERISSYKRLLAWFVLYSAAICLFAQFEIMYSPNDTISKVMEIQNFGIFGWLAFGLTFSLSPLLALYIYKFNGAEELTEHPGLWSKFPLLISEKLIWKCVPVLIFVAHCGFLVSLFAFKDFF